MPETRVTVTLMNGPPWGFRLHGGPITGLRVSRVRRRGPGDTAGLREGDTVLAINGIPLEGLSYSQAMELAERGPNLQLEVCRFKTFVTAMATGPHSECIVIGDVNQHSNSVILQPQESFEDESSIDTDNLEHVMPSDPEVAPIALEKLFKEASPNEIAQSPTKKDFADSAFYHDPNNYYPTVAEQKEMAKKVAKTLFDTRNIGSKGNNMFERRRQRAEKWVTESEPPNEVIIPPEPEHLDSVPTMDEVEKLKEAPPAPPLPAYLAYGSGIPIPPLAPPPPPNAPKTVKEFMEKVKKTPKAEHRGVEPEKCFDIAAALHSRNSKGAALFNKRRIKSQKWVLESEGTAGAEPARAVAPGMGLLAQLAVGQGPSGKSTRVSSRVVSAPSGIHGAPSPPSHPDQPSSGRLFEKIQRLQDAGEAWEQALSSPAHSRTTSAPVEDFLPPMSPMVTAPPMSPPGRLDEVPGSGPGGRSWRPVRFNRGDAMTVQSGGVSEL